MYIYTHIYMCIYIYIYIYHNYFIHSSVDVHLRCVYILTIVNSAAMNVGLHIPFQISVFIFYRIYNQEWNCWIIW